MRLSPVARPLQDASGAEELILVRPCNEEFLRGKKYHLVPFW